VRSVSTNAVWLATISAFVAAVVPATSPSVRLIRSFLSGSMSVPWSCDAWVVAPARSSAAILPSASVRRVSSRAIRSSDARPEPRDRRRDRGVQGSEGVARRRGGRGNELLEVRPAGSQAEKLLHLLDVGLKGPIRRRPLLEHPQRFRPIVRLGDRPNPEDPDDHQEDDGPEQCDEQL
jgi:hypothetical protein